MEKNLLRRSASGENSVSRVWLFLVLMLCGMASALQVQAQVTSLPTSHNGRWDRLNSSAPKAGWTHTGLATDATYNLGPVTEVDGSSRSATFDTSGDVLSINFSGITTQLPGEFSFYLGWRYTGTATAPSTFSGTFFLEESSNNSTWTSLQEFNSSNLTRVTATSGGGAKVTITPKSDTRYLRFRLATLPASTQVLVDQVSLTALPDAPEINVLAGSTQQDAGSTYTFSQQNINTSSAPVTFTIQNNGTLPLSITTPLVVTGTNPDQFQITQQPTSSSITAGSTTTFKVVFKPTSVLSKNAEIRIGNNDSNENPYTVKLQGSGILLAPTITSFDPKAGPVGTLVTITGANLVNTQNVLFSDNTTAGKRAAFTIVDNNSITATVPTGAITGKIKLTNNDGANVAVSSEDFTVYPAPIITSFSPTTGPVGTVVTVKGSNFSEGGGMKFTDANGNLIYAEDYVFVSETEATGRVPLGAVTGPIAMEGDYETTKSTTSFTVTAPAPVITSVSPNSGSVGTVVTVEGINLKNIKSITFGGVTATEYDDSNDNSLIIIVPAGAISGQMIVTTEGGSDESNFTVITTAPVITSFSPASGPVGTVVTVIGNNFSEGGGLKFTDANGNLIYAEDYVFVSETEVTGRVPAEAVTGAIAVENDTETTRSSTSFTVTVPAPVITSVSPNSGSVGTVVAVTGTNLTKVISVTFNGTVAEFDETPEGLNTVVPAGATSGPMVVKTVGGTDESNFLVLEPTTLPVELVNFSGESTPKGVLLTWSTASERNNEYFEVQASTNPTKEFNTIQKVESKVVNSSTVTSYETADRNPARNAVTYYRLKQVDLDGTVEYSKTIAVENKNSAPASSLAVYPNPFNDSFNPTIEITTEKGGKLTVALYYVTGKKAFEQVFTVESGVSTMELPLKDASLSTGMYILTTELNGKITTSRVVKN
ncbi:IPT/TIG domain-containing protein [Rufibacter roseolus]|uniref:IPT/TIG domain-containing protein n=1 Tax=Rufibacter roseolus TaxID=2817375 RepID=UPI001B30D484|nr:IPT/TIG domain-containing protein [Rufibacter roseolus]